MSVRTVFYQTVFAVPLAFPFTQTPHFLSEFTAFDTPRAPQYSAAEQQFSAFSGFKVAAAVTPAALSTFVPFDVPQAPKYAAADQQFSAWHSPFFGTRTPITPDWTAFDAPRAPQYAAAEQQFNSYSGFAPPPPVLAPNTPFDAPKGVQYSAAEQQFSQWHSPFFGTRTPSTVPPSTSFDQPQAPQVNAAQQQFTVFNGLGVTQTTLIAAFTSTPFDVAKAPQYSAAQQQFSVTDGFLPPPNPTLTPVFAPFDVSVARLFEAAQQQYSAYVGFTPPSGFLTPSTPFDAPKGLLYPAGEQQFSAWHSPFFGTRTPAYLATFVPFDTPQVPLYPAGQQQFSSYPGLYVAAALTPTTLSQFYVDTTIPQLQVSPALLQFNDLPMGPEETIAPVEEVIIGRWGPDETKEERKRRQEQGLFFQWEEQPARSEFAPDPVEHPPHEPQKTVDEPARVNKSKFGQASPEYLVTVLDDNPELDDETLELAQWYLELTKAYFS